MIRSLSILLLAIALVSTLIRPVHGQSVPVYVLGSPEYQEVLQKARAGNTVVQFYLGAALVQGVIEDNALFFDREGGYAWLLEAARKGHATAAILVEHNRRLGAPVKVDEAVWETIRSAARQGFPEARRLWGQHLLERSGRTPADLQEALQSLQQAAVQGDRWAQLELYSVYQEGRGVAADPVEAVAWLLVDQPPGRKRPDLSVSLANTISKQVKGREKDVEKRSLEIREQMKKVKQVQAAKTGDSQGGATMVATGKPLTVPEAKVAPSGMKDPEVALRNGARIPNNDMGPLVLAKGYLAGGPFRKDVPEGLRWMWVAAFRGNHQALQELAQIYSQGKDVPADPLLGMAFYELLFERWDVTPSRELFDAKFDAQDKLGPVGAQKGWILAQEIKAQMKRIHDHANPSQPAKPGTVIMRLQ